MTTAAPPRTVFVNGEFRPFAEATIPIMDRGFLFGDGIYEVTAVLDGKFVDAVPHLARLDRSLAEIGIANPHTTEEWLALQKELVRRNALREGTVYIEVTRGVCEREFSYPVGLAPTVVMFTQARAIKNNPAARDGVAIITLPDLRWARRDVKSTALLAQVIAKQAAKEAGVAEAWMVQDGLVTEGASSSAFIVTSRREIVTRPLSRTILPGITRRTMMTLAEKRGLTIVERPFSIAEALAADEAFYTSASTFAMPVISIDGARVADGKPGPVVRELRELYVAEIEAQPAE